MNNKLEVIGIDHGWSMMKTVTQVFVTGVKEITTTPALFGDVLEYDGKYYKIGTVRQEVKDTKGTGQSISSLSRTGCVRNMDSPLLMWMMRKRRGSTKAIRNGVSTGRVILYGPI